MPRSSEDVTRGARLARVTRHPLARGAFALGAVLVFAVLGARDARLVRADAPLPDPMPPLPLATGAAHAAGATDGGLARAADGGEDGGARDPALVCVNLATADELRKLPGVGPKRADAMLALRTRLGGFKRAEDLLRVKGVGRKTLARWRPRLCFDRARPEAADAGAPLSPPRP